MEVTQLWLCQSGVQATITICESTLVWTCDPSKMEIFHRVLLEPFSCVSKKRLLRTGNAWPTSHLHPPPAAPSYLAPKATVIQVAL
jgi:hypothetical protein